MSNPEESETTVVLRDGQLVLPDRIVRGDLLLEGAVIRSLAPAGVATGDEIWDLGGRKVTPGWIDTHIHGFDGVDFNAAVIDIIKSFTKNVPTIPVKPDIPAAI